MDSTRFERIESKEKALILIAQGEKLYDHNHNEFYYDAQKECVIRHDYCGSPQKTNITINNFLDKLLYLKKPFDVRQAMRDNPDEWVGAFQYKNEWWVVGSDTIKFRAIAIPYDAYLKNEIDGVTYPDAEELNSCIPINEVPK